MRGFAKVLLIFRKQEGLIFLFEKYEMVLALSRFPRDLGVYAHLSNPISHKPTQKKQECSVPFTCFSHLLGVVDLSSII